MQIGYDELTQGYEFPPSSYELTAPLISRYLEAVEGSQTTDFVPPMAVAAYAMPAMFKFLVLPPGVVHASQELEFCKPVPIGATISCRAKVNRKLARSKLRLLVIELNAFDKKGGQVLKGKATLIFPS
jgi:acyl dehydratase